MIENQRQYFRLDISNLANYRMLKFNGHEMKIISQKPFPAKFINISAGGAAIECDHYLQKEDFVELLFTMEGEDFNLLATVVWVQQGEKEVRVGLRFEIDEDIRKKLVRFINDKQRMVNKPSN